MKNMLFSFKINARTNVQYDKYRYYYFNRCNRFLKISVNNLLFRFKCTFSVLNLWNLDAEYASTTTQSNYNLYKRF